MPATRSSPDSAQHDALTSLMDEIREGSEPALGELMDLCWPELVRYAASQLGDVDLARDIAQEAFIQVWERRRGWRPRGSARVYLYRIVRHLVIDRKRRRAVRRRWRDRQGRDDAIRGGHAPSPADMLEASLLADRFRAAVASLPDRRREVFELVFQRGLTHAEAAAVMKVSAQTVANQMSAALRTVRRVVAAADG
ncbi:MAG: sigma-70 family RNA polymerase sigma factor [Gammaproteobacteria bacterium]|nr:sigma-70 family RNA polymerase sigma factor [Gammaproteobacteria bacterium]